MKFLSRLLKRADRRMATASPQKTVDARYVSPLDLPKAEEAELLRVKEASIFLPEGEGMRTFRRPAPAFLHDPDDVGLFRNVGEGSYTSPPPYILASPDVDLVGYRTVLFADRFTTDEAATSETALDGALSLLGSADPFLNEETGLRPTNEKGLFHLTATDRPARHLAGANIVLASHEPANYGSFLFRVVPKLTLLRFPDFSQLPIVVFAQAESTKRLLELLGIERERLVQHDPHLRTRIDRAILPGLRNPNAYLDEASRSLFLALADRFGGERRDRKIYVSRRGHATAGGSTRVMMNEDALVERLSMLGIEIVEPEKLTMDQQIQVFAQADLVIGPSGSGMFNIVFCRPGAVVIDIESEDHWIYAHAGLFASCGLTYGLFVGRPDPADERPVHRRWTVDIDALVKRIGEYL